MSRNKLNKMQLLIFALIISFALPLHQAAGGTWPQKKGTDYYKLDFRYMNSSKLYNSDGIKVSIPKLQDMMIGLFGFYKITDKLTGFIRVAVTVRI